MYPLFITELGTEIALAFVSSLYMWSALFSEMKTTSWIYAASCENADNRVLNTPAFASLRSRSTQLPGVAQYPFRELVETLLFRQNKINSGGREYNLLLQRLIAHTARNLTAPEGVRP